MMTNRQSVVEPQATTAVSVVLRHAPLCGIWLVLAAIGVGLAFVLQGPMRPLSALLGAYAVQGFVAELLGARIDAEFDRAAASIYIGFAFPGALARAYSLDVIERITSKRPLLGIEWASVRIRYGERASIVFSSRDQKMYFFKIIKDFQPTLALYRSN